MSEPIKCFIRIITPLHIGCDEVYEPTSFVVDEENHKLISFDALEFFRMLSPRDRNELVSISKRGTVESLLEVYKFMRGKKFNGHEANLSSGFTAHYKKVISLPLQDRRRIQQELNNLIISRTAFNGNNSRPYIPGSGIKGALRTAYLNLLAETKHIRTPLGKSASKDLEKTLLDGGSFETDPFRMVKVSDFAPVGMTQTRIVYAINEKKKASKYEARGPYQILEVVEPGAFFEGSITIDEPDRHAGIRNPITRETLLQSLRQFYAREKTREDQELVAINIVPVTLPATSACPMRIGRHSGAETVTIRGHRDIRIMKGRGEMADSLDHATTFWLASEEAKPRLKEGLRPFGWVVLGEVTEDVKQELEGLRERDQKEQLKKEELFDNPPTGKLPLPEPPTPPDSSEDLWPAATLTWNPGNSELKVSAPGKKPATVKGKEAAQALVPELLHKKLFQRREAVNARVTVEIDGNKINVVKIE